MPNVVAANGKFHDKGFDIVSISLDRANETAKLSKFIQAHQMASPQIFDGKYWHSEVAQAYAIDSIPHAFLIDGDSGVILADGVEVRGGGLTTQSKRHLRGEASGSKLSYAVYEYELCEGDCAVCHGRFTLRRPISAPELKACPACKKPVRKVISTFSSPIKLKPTSFPTPKKPALRCLNDLARGSTRSSRRTSVRLFLCVPLRPLREALFCSFEQPREEKEVPHAKVAKERKGRDQSFCAENV